MPIDVHTCTYHIHKCIYIHTHNTCINVKTLRVIKKDIKYNVRIRKYWFLLLSFLCNRSTIIVNNKIICISVFSFITALFKSFRLRPMTSFTSSFVLLKVIQISKDTTLLRIADIIRAFYIP